MSGQRQGTATAAAKRPPANKALSLMIVTSFKTIGLRGVTDTSVIRANVYEDRVSRYEKLMKLYISAIVVQ